MADSEGGDVLMYFVESAGTSPIPAEARSSLDGGYEKLMQGFQAGKYFEVENFSFSIELADDEGAELDDPDKRSYARWRGLKTNQPKPNPPFKAEPQDVSITRLIDSSSPTLLVNCLNTKRFHRAVLVKRARLGSARRLSPIMRMEFENVWIKAIEWEDGDGVKETCKFKYSAVKITYVSRKPDGSVDTDWPCEWKGLSNA